MSIEPLKFHVDVHRILHINQLVVSRIYNELPDVELSKIIDKVRSNIGDVHRGQGLWWLITLVNGIFWIVPVAVHEDYVINELFSKLIPAIEYWASEAIFTVPNSFHSSIIFSSMFIQPFIFHVLAIFYYELHGAIE